MKRIRMVLSAAIALVWLCHISAAAETRELHFKSPAEGMRFTEGLPIQVWADVIPRDDDHPGWPAAECHWDSQQIGERVLGNKRAYDYFPFTVPAKLVTAGRHTLTLAGFGREGRTIPPERSLKVEVDRWPADRRLIELTEDMTVTDLDWTNVAVRGNGHTVTAKGRLTIKGSLITGLGSMTIVDPSHADPDSANMTPGLTASLTGDVEIKDSVFEATGAMHLSIAGDSAALIANNEFRANNLIKFVPSRPEASPVILISETDAGSKRRDAASTVDAASPRVQNGMPRKRFEGNRVAAGIVRFEGASHWQIGGETDAASNVLIGPRCVLALVNCYDLHVIGNYIHHEYRGTWSQGFNLYCENSDRILAEHNVLRASSWPLQSFGGEFRYNLMIDSGHNWVRQLKSGTQFHHNLLVHTGDPYGTGIGAGLWLYNNCKNVAIYNNTFDGGAPDARDFDAPLISLSNGCSLSTLRNNVFTGIRPINSLANNAVVARGGREQDREPRIAAADFNCFDHPQAPAAANYDPGIVAKPNAGADDIKTNPKFAKGRLIPYTVDESAVWNRKYKVSQVLAAYRDRYRPADDSPLVNAGDPADGKNSYIGAIGTGVDSPGDRFGKFSDVAAEPGPPGDSAKPNSQAFRWQTVTPEIQGMSSERLAALWTDLAKRQTTSLLVIRNDRIVFERYAPGWGAAKPHGTASLAKALVGGMSLAVAITDDKISLDDPAARFIPQWKDDPRKQRILIRHLGSHTSGLDDAEADNVAHEALSGWKGDFWKRLDPPRDPFTIARDQTPLLFDPGAGLQYSNPAIGMLTYAVTTSLKDSPQTDVRSLLRERIMRPIGVSDAEWSIGYGKTITVDDLPLVASWGGGSFTPRAVAAIGRLLLREGDWDGKRLLSPAAVRQTTGDAGQPGNCGIGFFTNSHGRYPFLPRDAYWGAGAGDQVLLVVPSLKLIVVRNGQTLEPPPAVAGENKADIFVRFHDPRAKILFEPLIGTIKQARSAREESSAGPYPPSPVITGIAWSPPPSIIRRAEDSDNWPLTWGDDDALYTAYGDGTGFDPKVPEKLSLGFARIDGGPADFKGTNIRSATGERKGNGPAGPKASGLLMVDGVLYMLARNAGNSQLAWSTDHAKTWTWANWKFTTSFGCPTFLNFGKGYASTRDEFVYIYSPDADSAYLPADRIVLARVPKDRLKDRTAYEFFAGQDSAGGPTWTPDIRRRAAVFEHPGHVFRPSVSYNAGLRRYLLVQAGSTREVSAGFGIYDAPEPWGRWTTVTCTPHWDTDPGETASIPTKWISPDGRTLFLVFSGGDAFNVRKAKLKTETSQ